MREVHLRRATQQDGPFLYLLMKAALQEYVVQTWGWDEEWQQAHFWGRFDPAHRQIIVCDAQDIGVLTVEEHPDQILLGQIYILPAYQGQGIGTALIRSLLQRGAERGLPVCLRVLKVNPARQLYDRLGFVVTAETETHYSMEARPATAAPRR
jgi:GNAT superfamily N-acetyltransferase